MAPVDSLPDILRIINALLAFMSLVGMCALYPWWVTRPRAERFLLLSLSILVLVTGYGSLEAMFMDVPPGARVVLYTPSLLYCAYGVLSLYRKIKKHEKEDHHE